MLWCDEGVNALVVDLLDEWEDSDRNELVVASGD